MKLLEWFLQFFKGPRAALPAGQPRVKFVEGTEWICPDCGTTIAIANRDIYLYDIHRSSDWDIKDQGFWKREHCGRIAFKYGVGSHVQFLTPTGWVG